MLRSPSAAERRRACLDLAERRESDGALIALLDDTNEEVCEAAAWALKCAPVDLDLLSRVPASSLGPIAAVLAPRLDPHQRASLSRILIESEDASVLPALIALASHEVLDAALASEHAARRIAAASALAEIAVELTAALFRARTDPDPRVRRGAAAALGRTGSRAVEAMLEDPDPAVRIAAADALAGMGPHARAAETALAVLDTPDPSLRAAAARAVARSLRSARQEDRSELISALLAHLFDDAYEVHVECARGLGELGPEAAERAAEPVLRSVILPRPKVGFLISIHAILALSKLAPLALLRRTLRTDPDPRFRAAAATALGENGAKDAIPELTAALDDPEWLVGTRASAALIMAGELQAGSARLLRDVGDARPEMRMQIAFVLGRMPTFRADLFAPLVVMLEDPHPGVRTQAAESIGRWGELASSAEDALLPLLEDPSQRVRRQALRSLEDMRLVRDRRRLVLVAS